MEKCVAWCRGVDTHVLIIPRRKVSRLTKAVKDTTTIPSTCLRTFSVEDVSETSTLHETMLKKYIRSS